MDLPPYTNEPLTDFSKDENKEAMFKALDTVYGSFGEEYKIVIGGERIETGAFIESRNPASPNEVVGRVCMADKELSNHAVEVAHDAFDKWSRTHARTRVKHMLKAASMLRRKKHEFSATMIFEVGKSWAEADADIAEAIDFLEYYSRQMLRLAGDQEVYPFPGEMTTYRYIPLGVGVIIPPWNFPSAILTGMTSSALVTGNTAVLKPASDSPVVGAKIAEVLFETDLPRGVLNFVPGHGSTVGEALVEHPLTRFVSFTGSMDVGKGIYEKASIVWEGQRWLKRVVTEMGGKDCLIVDDPCDVDQAAHETILSAFGYQGQKCSACSRAIVVESIYDEYVKKLHDGVKGINVGPTYDPTHFMGPLSSEQAFKKVMKYIEIGKGEAVLMAGGKWIGEEGYFVEPTIFVDVDPGSRLAQEEIFGPVLSVIKAKDFEEALSIANDTIYGLTGGIFSKDRNHIERTKNELAVGNLYVNRKITGALVGVQPFGGYKMSGTCSKAGGPEHLLLFMQGKSIAERL
ncbi:MAG TPA: L-glutamate gamma-semialdehyde dehydrogenase [Candidatus Methanofastidiosa archaeon]|nr:L-glutamate gamma-semialdehyde dehydrogenase [Candidatus Methanofastidiosa archaeon]HPR41192.1 L-glutamate gamma-semialdehyde dehydrogenase [Candidatus Methanofastidiosa archaeon]